MLRDGRLDVSGIVQPAPGALAEVIVPMPARVVFTDDFRPAVGKRVRAGQTLAVLEQAYVLHDAVHLINERWPIFLDYLAARREVAWADAALARLRYQREEHGVPDLLVQQASARLELARQADQRAQRLLQMHDAQITAKEPYKHTLTAPINGTIIAANFTQGQMVYENQPLFTVADLGNIWVELKVPEPYVPVARRAWSGEKIELFAPAFGADAFVGRLVRTGPAVDERTRTLAFHVAVRNPGERLRLGMLVRAPLPLGNGPDVTP
jgi:multidrug efflux pump subunit AcrA (membrane-fusion protein)